MHTGRADSDRGRHQAGLAACLLAGLLTAMGGCGSPAVNVGLPARPVPVRPVPVRPVPGKPVHVGTDRAAAVRSPARELVLAAYEGYWRATNQALASRDASRARAIIAGYVPVRAVPALVRGYREIWRGGEVGYGSPVFHIMSVTITGRGRVAVHDCVDLSHAGFADQQTGEVVEGAGSSHDFMITTLALMHGRWLVTGAIAVGQKCAR
jgi:hypothetical protein